MFNVHCSLSYERNHFTCTNGFNVPYTMRKQIRITIVFHEPDNLMTTVNEIAKDAKTKRTTTTATGARVRDNLANIRALFTFKWILYCFFFYLDWMDGHRMHAFVRIFSHSFQWIRRNAFKIHWTFSRKWKKCDWISGKSIVASSSFRCATYTLKHMWNFWRVLIFYWCKSWLICTVSSCLKFTLQYGQQWTDW